MTSTQRLFYSSELMLKFRDSIPRVKPSLPDLDIVLEVAQLPLAKSWDSHSNAKSSNDFNAKYQKNFNNDGRRYQRNWNTDDSLKRNTFNNADKKLDSIFETPVELHKSESAWKPSNKQDSKDDMTEMLQKMQSLLNKLAPENFDIIVSQVKSLQMDTIDRLDGCAKLLFEKVISEPHFAPTYANMAQSLGGLSIADATGKSITFKYLLLQKCQKEFQRDKNDDAIISDLVVKINSALIDEEKKTLTEEKELAEMKSKRRSLGNVKFIGELFKLSMLNENIMVQCLYKLLDGNEDEECLECLCKLLSTVGKSLEDKSVSKVDSLMTELDKLKSNKTTNQRIKFMIMDVVDLRKDGWISKKNEGPKKISQIHMEAEKEKIERAEAAQLHIPHVPKPSHASYNSTSRNSNTSNFSRPIQSRLQGQGNENNRNGSDSRPQRYESNRNDSDSRPQRYESNRNDSDSRPQKYENNRNGSDPRPQRYESNRNGSDSRPQRYESNRNGSDSRPQRYESNRNDSGPRPQRYENNRNDYESRPQRYENNRYSSNSDNWRNGGRSNDKPRESTYQNRGFSSNYERRNNVVESDRNKPPVKNNRPEPIIEEVKIIESISKVEDVISREEMERKVNSRIEEFLSLNDLKEAMETIKELKTDVCFKNAVRFFYISLTQNIEKSSKVREQIGILHKKILDHNVAPFKAYADAWIKFSKFAGELIVDIPKVWTYISELITPVVLESSAFKMNMFAETDSPDSELDDEYIVDDNSKAKLFAAILNGVSKKKDDLEARKIWIASRLRMQDFVKDISVEEFKSKFNLLDIMD